MIDHPNSKAPLSDPGCLGLVCLFAAPILAGVFGLDGIAMVLGLIGTVVAAVLIGLAFGKK